MDGSVMNKSPLLAACLATMVLVILGCNRAAEVERAENESVEFRATVEVVPVDTGDVDELRLTISNNTANDVRVRRLEASEGSIQLHFRTKGAKEFERQYPSGGSPDLEGVVIPADEETSLRLPHHLQQTGIYDVYFSVILTDWESDEKVVLTTNLLSLTIRSKDP